MKKILIAIFMFVIMTILISLSLLPNINYTKLEYVSSSSSSQVSLNLQNESSVSDTEQKDPLNYERVIILQLCLSYEEFTHSSELSNSLDLNDYKLLQFEFRQKAKKYHKGNNESIINKILFGNYQDIYISTYSPFIDITYNYDYFMKHKNYILAIVTNIPLVKNVTVFETEIETKESIISGCEVSDALDVYESRNKTGAGAVVGILENGIINKNHNDLADTSITIRSSASNLVCSKTHSTNMALIIAGKNGVAPGASLLSAYLSGTMNAEIDWMLDKGVDIINMSFVQTKDYGTYNSMSAYADYIAYTYDVIIVACAGNYDTTGGLVGNPGLGYNVITVGGVWSNGIVMDDSSYKESNCPIKPTISTYCNAIVETGSLDFVSGTSVSTAFCSGFIALILEDHRQLLWQKSKLIALMCANATINSSFDLSEDNGFDDKAGAGIFNYQNMIDNFSTAYYVENNSYKSGETIMSETIYVKAGQTIRAAICSLAKSTGTVNSLQFTDYDIAILDKQGNILSLANSWNSTIDVATYKPYATDYYKIEVYQDTDRVVTTDKLGFAYSIN